jgi:hypothetical protein
MARGFKKKGKFDDLDTDFKSTIENMSDAEIRVRIAEVVLNQRELMAAKKLDKDLQEKQALVKQLSEKYRKVSSLNDFRIEYAKDLNGSDDTKVKEAIATSALDEVSNLKEKDDDVDLTQAKLNLKDANESYSSATKMNKLRVGYAHFILEARGKV